MRYAVRTHLDLADPHLVEVFRRDHLQAFRDAVEDAIEDWTGRTWDDPIKWDIAEVESRIEELKTERRGRREVYAEAESALGAAREANTERSQQEYLLDVASEELALVSEELALASEELKTLTDRRELNERVEERAAEAARLGRDAVRQAAGGHLRDALETLNEAGAIERYYVGDDPAWRVPARRLTEGIEEASANLYWNSAEGLAEFWALVEELAEGGPPGVRVDTLVEFACARGARDYAGRRAALEVGGWAFGEARRRPNRARRSTDPVAVAVSILFDIAVLQKNAGTARYTMKKLSEIASCAPLYAEAVMERIASIATVRPDLADFARFLLGRWRPAWERETRAYRVVLTGHDPARLQDLVALASEWSGAEETRVLRLVRQGQPFEVLAGLSHADALRATDQVVRAGGRGYVEEESAVEPERPGVHPRFQKLEVEG